MNTRHTALLFGRNGLIMAVPGGKGIFPAGCFTGKENVQMPRITQITSQDRADRGFRTDTGRDRRAAPRLPAAMQDPLCPPPKLSPPQRRVQIIAATEQPERRKLKVAAYCRVSTLMESQEGSIAAQRRHYQTQIEANPAWELAGIYLEAGVSGTGAESRPELQRLLADCRAGRVQLILTKSISRFARNTSDCLKMVRQLTGLGVHIRFEKEGIHTGTMGSELLLSVLACLAEDESRSISENLKWGIRKRFQNSTYKMAFASYGYRREGNDLVIVPGEAEIVRGIFRAVLSGCGAGAIAAELNDRGVVGPTGKAWLETTVRGIVKNPVYAGDMLYQKTYMDESYRQQINRGELDRFYDQDHHAAIVDREVFALANANMRQRGRECGSYTREEQPEQAARRERRYAFSGKLFCAACGAPMHRVGAGSVPTYRCAGRRDRASGCDNGSEREDSVKNAFITCLNKLAYSQRLAPKKRVLDRFVEELREADKCTETAEALRQTVSRWAITDRTEDFPAAAFSELVERAVLASRESVRFFFACGLVLTESLRRDAE